MKQIKLEDIVGPLITPLMFGFLASTINPFLAPIGAGVGYGYDKLCSWLEKRYGFDFSGSIPHP
ncbi:hypothetical protein FJZ19_03905 [Candidatus Pacearchaeota archaeon]|nr:hypothetical protein [Candidatus Pacearchaeota archaeon]